MPRPAHTDDRPRRRTTRPLLLLAVAALVVAACGADDTIEIDSAADGGTTDALEDDATQEPDGSDETDTDPAESEPADADPDDSDETDSEETDTDPAESDPADTDPDTDEAADRASDDGTEEQESGTATERAPSEHRPTPAAREAIDCAAVASGPTGAVIVFPDGDDPSSLQAGTGPVTVEVVGCSDSFEANIQYDAFLGQASTPTLSGFTMGGTLGDWDVFSFEETYWTPGDWTVVVFVDDAESGDRVEYDQVTFTVD